MIDHDLLQLGVLRDRSQCLPLVVYTTLHILLHQHPILFEVFDIAIMPNRGVTGEVGICRRFCYRPWRPLVIEPQHTLQLFFYAVVAFAPMFRVVLIFNLTVELLHGALVEPGLQIYSGPLLQVCVAADRLNVLAHDAKK